MVTFNKIIYKFRSVEYDFSKRTYIMGILNVTPDSFSDGGKYFDSSKAVERALEMIEEGADFIDVGGESTRPGSEEISVDEELKRVIPIIKSLNQTIKIPISVDTTKSRVAEESLNAGAEIVNDISGFRFDPNMAEVAAKYKASVILMHIKDKPKTMQQNPVYQNLIEEIYSYLLNGTKIAEEKGIDRIFVDPGIGFGKNLEQNVEIFKRLSEFKKIGYPILIGPSRKSFIGNILELPVEQRLEGTAATVAISIINGANVIRVHDVKEMKRVAKVVDALK
ncbi:MAG: dihydropteroate synthase [Bacteroidota bacterium]|nr:dihydropteroate synthase [Bacteroidota bacterium]